MSYGTTKAEAQAKCEALLSQMSGEGWEMYIRDNMGWYYYVINGLLSVHETESGEYYACLSCDERTAGSGSYLWTDTDPKKMLPISKTPDAAVRHKLKMARKAVEELMEIVTVAEIASDQRPATVKYGPCPKCMAKKGKA